MKTLKLLLLSLPLSLHGSTLVQRPGIERNHLQPRGRVGRGRIVT
jgi:hypothetical protein